MTKSVLIVLLMTASLSNASTFFNLSFTLRVDQKDGVLFPKGHIVGGRHFNYYPYYSKLNVSARAQVMRIVGTKVYFNFLDPVKVETMKDGEITEIEYKRLTVNLNLPDVARMRKMIAYNPLENLIVRNGKVPAPYLESRRVTEINTIQKVLEFARNSPTIEPLAQNSNLPMIQVFDGDIRIARHFEGEETDNQSPLQHTIAYNEFKTGEIDAKLSSCDLNELIGLDPATGSLLRGRTFYSEIEAFDRPFTMLESKDAREFIRIRQRIEEIRMRQVIRFHQVGDHVEVVQPKNNVIPLRPACEDIVGNTEPTWKDLFASIWRKVKP